MSRKRRRSRRRGALTVVALVAAAVLLLVVGNLLRGTPARRAPAPGATPVAGGGDEIDDAARRELERVLRQDAPR